MIKMILTGKGVYEKIFVPLGINIGDLVEIDDDDSPYELGISGEGEYCFENENNYFEWFEVFDKSIKKVAKGKQQVEKQLSELAGDWKPDWEDPTQLKWEIIFSGSPYGPDSRCTHREKHANSIYFKTEEEADKAIKMFTEEEWRNYFEV